VEKCACTVCLKIECNIHKIMTGRTGSNSRRDGDQDENPLPRETEDAPAKGLTPRPGYTGGNVRSGGPQPTIIGDDGDTQSPPPTKRSKGGKTGLGSGRSFKLMGYKNYVCISRTVLPHPLILPVGKDFSELYFVHFCCGWIPQNVSINDVFQRADSWAREHHKSLLLTMSASRAELLLEAKSFKANSKGKTTHSLILAHGIYQGKKAEIATRFVDDFAVERIHINNILEEFKASESMSLIFCNTFAKMNWFKRLDVHKFGNVVLISGQANISCEESTTKLDVVLNYFLAGTIPFVFYRNKLPNTYPTVLNSLTLPNLRNSSYISPHALEEFASLLGDYRLCCNYQLLWSWVEFHFGQPPPFDYHSMCRFSHNLQQVEHQDQWFYRS